jgi:hypothetical protein
MNRDAGKFVGPILIVLGLFMLLSQLGLPAFGMLWPLLLLVVGGAMIWRYRQSREDSGMVFTGVLLALLALFFQFVQWDWVDIGRHWPFFVLAPGIAFLVMSRADAERGDAAVPGWILVGLALIFYFFSLGFFVALLQVIFKIVVIVGKVVIPLGLIALGGWLLFGRGRGLGHERNAFPEKIDPHPPTPEPDAGGPAGGLAVDPGPDAFAEPMDAEEEGSKQEPAAEPGAEPGEGAETERPDDGRPEASTEPVADEERLRDPGSETGIDDVIEDAEVEDDDERRP